TVTTGKMALHDVITASDVDRAQLLRLAGAIENASEHPIAQAIAAGAIDEVGPLPEVRDFANVVGSGVRGSVDGHDVIVGRESLMVEFSLQLDPELTRAKAKAEAQGETAVVVAWDGAVRGVLVVADTVKPTSAEAVSQ